MCWRMSTRITDRPSVFFMPSDSGVVRASSSIRSECSARLVQIFCPLITQSSPSRSAEVLSAPVSVPEVGSVTPKACSLNRPAAISGR
jgi:hypothetical protein